MHAVFPFGWYPEKELKHSLLDKEKHNILSSFKNEIRIC